MHFNVPIHFQVRLRGIYLPPLPAGRGFLTAYDHWALAMKDKQRHTRFIFPPWNGNTRMWEIFTFLDCFFKNQHSPQIMCERRRKGTASGLISSASPLALTRANNLGFGEFAAVIGSAETSLFKRRVRRGEETRRVSLISLRDTRMGRGGTSRMIPGSSVHTSPFWATDTRRRCIDWWVGTWSAGQVCYLHSGLMTLKHMKEWSRRRRMRVGGPWERKRADAPKVCWATSRLQR